MKINKTAWIDRFLACYTLFFGRLRAPETLTPESEFKHIAIYSSTALGDLMFNTPAIHAIKQRYPNAKLTLVSSRKNGHLVENSDYFDRVLYWDNKVKDVLRLVLQLRQQRPQLTIILHSYMPYDVLAAVLSGSEYIIRDHYGCDSAILNRWLAAHSGEIVGHLHLIQRKLDLLQVLGCHNRDTRMHILVDFPKVEKIPQTIMIGFQMGASEEIRRWPVSHFVGLAKQLFTRGSQYHIALIGSSKETGLEQEFLGALTPEEQQRVTSYIAKTTLPQLLGIIQSLDLLVTGDTGPLHLAIALQTKTISLFYTANPKYTGPYQDSERHHILSLASLPEHCSPQEKQWPLSVFKVEEVLQVIEEIK